MDQSLGLHAHFHRPSPSSSPPNITIILSPSRDPSTSRSSCRHHHLSLKMPPPMLLLYPPKLPPIAAIFLITLPPKPLLLPHLPSPHWTPLAVPSLCHEPPLLLSLLHHNPEMPAGHPPCPWPSLPSFPLSHHLSSHLSLPITIAGTCHHHFSLA